MRCNWFSIIQIYYTCKCVKTFLELNWNQRLRDKQIKLNICHHMLTLSLQLQNRSFHVVERTRTSAKCLKMKNARAKRAKLLFFIFKYANLWRSWCRCRRGYLNSLTCLKSTVIVSLILSTLEFKEYRASQIPGTSSQLVGTGRRKSRPKSDQRELTSRPWRGSQRIPERKTIIKTKAETGCCTV